MPRGSKKSYTSKQKRQAHHIEQSAKKSGKSSKRAAQIAYATVNKQDGGGKKSGSGRGHKTNKAAARRGGKNSHKGRSRSRTKSSSSRRKSR
ncbi:MAG TPA: hypothetical protein VL463_13095 [Kofleriaceae bacterium]|jgi:hypothetical protein|nr:hypothetical protein [Kofleriaceae bacterium]